MHRFLAVLLILMVPVRVFAAESLGLCMLQTSAQHQQSMASMPDDCPMMEKTNAPTSEHPKHDGGCESCQLCMPLAGPDDTAIAGPSAPKAVAPTASIADFRNAEIDRALRPPIS